MPTIQLTEVSIRNLKPVPGKRVTYLDKSGPKGFDVRVTETGGYKCKGTEKKRLDVHHLDGFAASSQKPMTVRK